MTSILEVLTARPKSKRELAFLMGWTTREVELEVHRYRLSGIPILSNGDGYWYAQTPDEVRLCASKLKARAIRQLETAQALDRAADKMPLSLWNDAA
jgi:biotin operon repressor